MIRIPVFRAGKFVNMAKLIRDGAVTDAHLTEIANNTARMMRETTWRPRVKIGHGDGETAGWVEGAPEVDGKFLTAGVDLLENTKWSVRDKRYRYISVELDKGASLTGDADGEKLGLRLKAIAILDKEDPAIKDLVDLPTALAVEDAQQPAQQPAIFRESILRDEDDALVYFAEIDINPDEEADMARTEELEATLAEERTAKSALEAQFAEEKTKRETLEAQLAEIETGKKKAAFAEHVKSVKAKIAAAQQAKKLGAEAAKKLVTLGVMLYPQSTEAHFAETLAAETIEIPAEVTPLALFEEAIDGLAVAVPTTGVTADAPPPAEACAVTLDDFAKIYDPTISAKIHAEVLKRRETKPDFTANDLAAELAHAAK